jgi:hypothetical protein
MASKPPSCTQHRLVRWDYDIEFNVSEQLYEEFSIVCSRETLQNKDRKMLSASDGRSDQTGESISTSPLCAQANVRTNTAQRERNNISRAMRHLSTYFTNTSLLIAFTSCDPLTTHPRNRLEIPTKATCAQSLTHLTNIYNKPISDNMDRPLTATMWPTRPPNKQFNPPQPQSTVKEHTLAKRLQEQSVALLHHPYDPSGWIARSTTLAALGFPELAVGDAHKASRLCESMLGFMESRPEERWSLGSGSGFWMRDENTPDTSGKEDDLTRSKTALKALNAQAHWLQESNFCYRQHREGSYIPQDYPWLEAKHRVRGQSVLNDISMEVANNKVKAPSGFPYIQVKRCTFRPDETDDSDSASLGIFATDNLLKDTKILVDRTNYFGCNGPGLGNSRANLGGAEGCGDRLHPNIVEDGVGHDLRWVRERAGTHAADPLLLCRILLACIRADVESPLDQPAVARLTAAYHRQDASTFQLDRDFAIINDALEQFGIDIFANHRYDTWVLFTISARLHNNSWTNPIAVSLNPLFSLFNHSCDPNAEWQTQKDHRTVVMRTSRDVMEGEQLLVEYDSFVHDEAVGERRHRLARWIDGPCMCRRCVLEEQTLLRTRSDDARFLEEKAANMSSFPSVTPFLEDTDSSKTASLPRKRDSVGSNENGDGLTSPAWDTEERPTLPEDEYWTSV